MTKDEITKYLDDIVSGDESEVLKVKDGHVFFFTETLLEKLLNASRIDGNIHRKAVLFVKTRSEKDIN